jgi:hypothetical protein
LEKLSLERGTTPIPRMYRIYINIDGKLQKFYDIFSSLQDSGNTNYLMVYAQPYKNKKASFTGLFVYLIRVDINAGNGYMNLHF